MNFEEKIDTLHLLFDIMRNDQDSDEKMIEQLASEAKNNIRDLHHYFFVLHFYNDTQWIPITVHKDPSVKYFGMDWDSLFEKIDMLRALIKQYHQDHNDKLVKEILETLQEVAGDLTCHLVAVRSGRLKSKTLKDQEALQRRVAMAARTGHDKHYRFDGIVSLWRKIFK